MTSKFDVIKIFKEGELYKKMMVGNSKKKKMTCLNQNDCLVFWEENFDDKPISFDVWNFIKGEHRKYKLNQKFSGYILSGCGWINNQLILFLGSEKYDTEEKSTPLLTICDLAKTK